MHFGFLHSAPCHAERGQNLRFCPPQELYFLTTQIVKPVYCPIDFQLFRIFLRKNACKNRKEDCNFGNRFFPCATFAPKFGFMQQTNILFRNFALMKISHLIFGSLLLALTACNPSQREAKQLLRQAESVLETYPESALHLIDSAMHMEVYPSTATTAMPPTLLHRMVTFCLIR